MFNTSLHYELPVLKTMAYELLLAIPKSAPEYLVDSLIRKLQSAGWQLADQSFPR